MSTPFHIIAKAGGCQEHPENTCEAFASAMAIEPPSGYVVALEVDVRLSSDDVPVAIHDATLERTTSGRGQVRRHTATQLRALRAGAGGERVPLLEEVIDVTADRELVVELHDDHPQTVQAVLRCLRRSDQRVLERIVVVSEHDRLIHALRAASAGVRTAATSGEAKRRLVLGAVGLGRWAPRGHVWMVPERYYGLPVTTRGFVERARNAGDEVWAFVVDEAVAAQRLHHLGVSGVFTTCPASLSAQLSEHPQSR